jgi:hypothetical protein
VASLQGAGVFAEEAGLELISGIPGWLDLDGDRAVADKTAVTLNAVFVQYK